ncbi:hypothetical protein M2103_000362 [Ereboglobus sp. PH5-5]|uniref:hypothetical protein n=1 Tax=Ereboglobus sp. PH5-5 TaxID=2940529 RepID=UPI002406DBC9|nr:hypothetical protein [Ereboglobus sp. PH5-5]MDF9832154.1 hypothetical protein [Ereboglobus sp. PH5-5]
MNFKITRHPPGVSRTSACVFAFAFCVIFSPALTLPAQTKTVQTAVLEYNFPGRYERQAAQGMAIYGEIALLFNNGGHCRIYNLKTKKKLTEFDLACAAETTHANSASFGIEQPKGAFFPALYVSECFGEGNRRCFVESISPKGPRIIQTLEIKTGGIEERSNNWMTDPANKVIYSIATFRKDSKKHVMITKWPLPPLGKKKIIFRKSDMLDQFAVPIGESGVQDTCIRGDYLYHAFGFRADGEGSQESKNREILVINLKTKKIEKIIDINDSCPLEPEGLDFYGDVLYLYCNGDGGLWRIPGVL